MSMKFPGKCTVCGKTVDTGQVGFWARGIGVKHEECSQVAELECMACGAPAGCPLCEFADFCNPSSVSQKCICTKQNAQTQQWIRFYPFFPSLNVPPRDHAHSLASLRPHQFRRTGRFDSNLLQTEAFVIWLYQYRL